MSLKSQIRIFGLRLSLKSHRPSTELILDLNISVEIMDNWRQGTQKLSDSAPYLLICNLDVSRPKENISL